ncbi:MAG: hypothetical protein WD225_09255, partial [Ilumatobacteraceae bacterium]
GQAGPTRPPSADYTMGLSVGRIMFRLEWSDRIQGTSTTTRGGWRVLDTTRGLPPAQTDVLEARWEHELDLNQATGLTDAEVTLYTNVPVQVTEVTSREVRDSDAPCRSLLDDVAPDRITTQSSPTTTNQVRIHGLCPGMRYDVELTVVDDDGVARVLTAFDADQIVRVPHLGAVYDVQVELLTESRTSLDVMELDVRVEGRRVFERFDPVVGGVRRPDARCPAAENGVVELLSWSGAADPYGRSPVGIEAVGHELDVMFDIVVGNAVSDGRGSCRAPSISSARYQVELSSAIADLNGGSNNLGLGGSAGALGNTLVFETELDDDLAVRVTLRPHPLGTTWGLAADG